MLCLILPNIVFLRHEFLAANAALFPYSPCSSDKMTKKKKLKVPSMERNKKTIQEFFFEFCEKNRLDDVDFLIDRCGLNINCVSDEFQLTGLSIAAKNNNVELLELLLSTDHVDVNMVSYDETALIVACRNKNHEIVQKLLEVPEIATTHRSGELKKTAMHYAAEMCENCCEELSNCDSVDWNIVDANGNTPLHTAIYAGNVEGARSIMEVYGVDFNTIRDGLGLTIVELVVREPEGDYKLDILIYLTQAEEANFNIVDENGDSHIMWTLKNNLLDRFHVLLNCPTVDLNIKDKDGNTIALWAIKNKKLELLKLILQKPEVDVTVEDSNGDTVTMIAR